jgi:hypothetical protein
MNLAHVPCETSHKKEHQKSSQKRKREKKKKGVGVYDTYDTTVFGRNEDRNATKSILIHSTRTLASVGYGGAI